MASPENTQPQPPDPNQPGPDQYQQPQDPESAGRFRTALRAAGVAITDKLTGMSYSGVDRASSHHTHSLRGVHENETVTTTDPLTGESTSATGQESSLPRWKIPIGQKHHVGFHDDDPNKSASERLTHPMLKKLVKDIATPVRKRDASTSETIHTGEIATNFKLAVEATDEAANILRNAAYTPLTMRAKAANFVLPAHLKRDAQIRRKYEKLNHDIYEAVMSVPHLMPVPTPPGEPKFRDRPPQRDDRDWSAQLNLRNIQELRSKMMEYHSRRSNEPKLAHDLIRTTGVRLINNEAFAAYLGVDADALEQQVSRGGRAVVPPAVLAKINFFLAFADDKTPDLDAAGNRVKHPGLSEELARFNTSYPNSTEPLDRLNEVLNPDRTAAPYSGPPIARVTRDLVTGKDGVTPAIDSAQLFPGGIPKVGPREDLQAYRSVVQTRSFEKKAAEKQHIEDAKRRAEQAEERRLEKEATDERRHQDKLAQQRERDERQAAETRRNNDAKLEQQERQHQERMKAEAERKKREDERQQKVDEALAQSAEVNAELLKLLRRGQ